MKPPSQPLFSSFGGEPFEQSTNCCSDNSINFPVFLAFKHSTAAVVVNAQQDPHDFWSRTRVTKLTILRS